MTIRTFIAIDLNEETRKSIDEVVEKWKQKYNKGINWVAINSLHVTLKFLGNIEESVVPDVRKIMEEAVKEMAPFKFTVKGCGAFPKPSWPRVIWIGIENDTEFKKLHKALDEKLCSLGVAREEREYSAHLTVGRVKDHREIKGLKEIFPPYLDHVFGVNEACECILFKSELHPTGAVYTPLERVPFSKPSGS